MKRTTATIAIALTLASCSHKAEQASPVWDEVTATYTIPADGLSYTVPTPADNWVVAPAANLPPRVLFCGVETNDLVVMTIISPQAPASGSSVTDYTPGEIDMILREVVMNNSPGVTTSVAPAITSAGYLGEDAVRFRVDVSVAVPGQQPDTMAVTYAGYLFDAAGAPRGIMATVPTEQADSAAGEWLTPYFDALHKQ